MYELDPDRVVFDVTEIEEVIAERDEALARVEELTSELTAYQVGDSDRSLAGEAEWADVLALRRIKDENLILERDVDDAAKDKAPWYVSSKVSAYTPQAWSGRGHTIAKALAVYDRERAKSEIR